jgi:signal transduction histidine kinase
VFFSIIIVSSIGVTTFFAITYTESGVIESALSDMRTDNTRIMHDIDTLHARASEDLVFALKNPKFVEYFELPETKAGNVYDENNVLQFTENQRKIKQDLEHWIYNFQNKFSVDETCIIDTSGQEHARLVLTKIESDENLSPNESSAPFFEPSFMKKRDEVHVQYPYVSPDTNRWVFAYVSPIELDNGQKPAIYHFEMPLSVLQKLLKTDDGRFYVLDPAGYVIADSAGSVPGDTISFVPEKQFPPFQSVFASSTSDVLDEMISHDSGDGFYFVNGEKHYYVYEKLSTFEWILIHEKPISMILVGGGNVSNLINTIIIVASIVSALGFFGVVLISSRISRPINQLATKISTENPERLEELQSPNHEIEQIAHSVNQLIKKVNEYQEEIHLQNQELIIQKQQLERLAKIGEHASRLTHNIRNPLAVIKATTELLQLSGKESFDEPTMRRLDRIMSATENLEKQIQEVLTYVRNKPLDLTNVSLDKLLALALEHIDVPENIKIVLLDNNRTIQCDSDKLQIVLMNLITNSIEALSGKGTITINSNSTTNANIIEVTDDGPGISPEHLTKVFDSLFTTKSTGTGLGLSYCKSVVEQHGGSIIVTTNPTKFTISLPLQVISKHS